MNNFYNPPFNNYCCSTALVQQVELKYKKIDKKLKDYHKKLREDIKNGKEIKDYNSYFNNKSSDNESSDDDDVKYLDKASDKMAKYLRTGNTKYFDK